MASPSHIGTFTVVIYTTFTTLYNTLIYVLLFYIIQSKGKERLLAALHICISTIEKILNQLAVSHYGGYICPKVPQSVPE